MTEDNKELYDEEEITATIDKLMELLLADDRKLIKELCDEVNADKVHGRTVEKKIVEDIETKS